MTDITEKLLDFSGENIGQYMPAVQPMPVGVLIAASDEIQQLRQQVSLWKSAAEAYEMGFFDKGDLLIDKARGGSDFIKEASRD